MATKTGSVKSAKRYVDPRSSPEFKELMRKMRSVPVGMTKAITRGAVRASANVYVQQAKKNIKAMPVSTPDGPTQPGAISAEARQKLLKSVRVRSPKVLVKKGIVRGGVSMKDKIVKRSKGEKIEMEGAWWWPFVEFGTVQRFTSKGHNRGAIVAHPFMRPAFDSVGTKPVKAYEDYMKARFDTEMTKALGGKK